MPLFCFDTFNDYLDAAREMARTGHPTLARLLAEEAAERATNPDETALVRGEFPSISARQGD
ncbi:hypothetical protein [Streptomyces sp. GC420]|uniref:hypothetical protein n=1 Tax=Streptomyces sp. GC420 TaxID=2697568 RepID=UPI001414FB1B|nr:hypothetical protein [Streptomyces sp. GC420]NBM17064.1 hypothetical protein [Streptomyces sp. GC420]